MESLDLLMAKDPLTLTEEQILRIVGTLRTARNVWAKAEAAGATKAPRAASIAGPKKAAPAELSLDDLGLDL